ncbi:sigma factor-like helix-turn-helix DNA-binding protein [uncultured Williamsia sp.]|uniref:sigma factor-like helix-turn-helix DNA-binding protein n=1 Tax=uncultured Williamsia sp. TaxID=259311 RepID=UPI0026314E06|nr:sigma factor-like helix-turn-helix DNA-binding protein [uncultured Williamsia sp.]
MSLAAERNEDTHPQTWGDAFPWLPGVIEADQPNEISWSSERLDSVDPATRQQRMATVVELAMERLPRWTVGQIFPGLSPDVQLLKLNLPARALNAFIRFEAVTTEQILGISIEELLDWRQIGVGTAESMFRVLAEISTRQPTSAVSDTVPRNAPTDRRRLDDANFIADWAKSLIDDLIYASHWFATIGLPERELLGDPFPLGTPARIVDARKRIEQLTAKEVVADKPVADAASLIDQTLLRLDSRAIEVLAARLFADKPMTLDDIGHQHGVTRERIRQIEAKARGTLTSAVSESAPLAAVAKTVRGMTSTIRPLDEIVDLLPALGYTVPQLGQPAWRFFDRLDDAYEIEGDWCVVPTINAVRELTNTHLQELSDPYGVVDLKTISIIETQHASRRAAISARWLSECGYVVYKDYALTRTSSVGDYAAAILSLSGRPLSAQEIIEEFTHERTLGALRNAMGLDPRLERVDRDKWALKEWGLDAYGGIRSLITEQVVAGGGHIRLSEIVESITRNYSVSANSVVAYASAPPFSIKNGFVQFGDSDRIARKTPTNTRRLFRVNDGWAYRVQVTADHLRGSGSIAPRAVATLLSLNAGEMVQLESPLGPQTVTWTGIQPSFGTIRRFLLAADAKLNAEAFLVLEESGRFGFRLARSLVGEPLKDALTLIDAEPFGDIESARLSLARAVELPDDSPMDSIIGAYRERGDEDIAKLLTDARHLFVSATEAARVDVDVDVHEIMDLL